MLHNVNAPVLLLPLLVEVCYPGVSFCKSQPHNFSLTSFHHPRSEHKYHPFTSCRSLQTFTCIKRPGVPRLGAERLVWRSERLGIQIR